MNDKDFKEKEMSINIGASLVAGSISAAITNPLEMITVNKQTDSRFNIKEFVQREGLWNVCVKGIVPRVAYNGFQSIMFFSLVMKLGKIYDVELGED